MMMTDSSGSVVWQGEFKPFGEPLSISGSVTNNLRFSGQYYDSETGLHQNWHRDYMPEIGRYVEADPVLQPANNNTVNYQCSNSSEPPFESLLENPQALNPYVYTADNPVRYIDPKGLAIIVPGVREMETICRASPNRMTYVLGQPEYSIPIHVQRNVV